MRRDDVKKGGNDEKGIKFREKGIGLIEVKMGEEKG